MAKPNFTLPNKPAIKSGSILSYNYTDDFTFVPAPLTFNRDSAATRVNEKGLIEDVGYFGPELVQNGDFSEIGPELVTNGSFDTDSDWNKTGTWSVESNYATASGNSTSQYIQQDFTITNSKVYKFTYEIIENTLNGNGASLSSSGGFGSVSLSNVVGYHTEYITASNQSATYALKIGVSGTATSGQITIDNISVKQVDPNDYWTLGTGWSFGDGVATCDGSQTSGTFLQQTPITFTNGNTYKVVFTCTIQAGNLDARLQGSGATVTGTSRTSSGTYTEYLVSTGNTSFRMRGNADFIGSVDNISVIEVKGDKPRIDYTDSLTSPSFLLEPQSTNLVTFSEDFSQWGLGDAQLLSATHTNPDGTTSAKVLAYNGGTNQHYMSFSPSVSSGQDYTFSIFVKAKELKYVCLIFLNDVAGRYFDLENGTLLGSEFSVPSNSRIEDFGNGWYRCSITDSATSTTKFSGIYLSQDGTSIGPYIPGTSTDGLYVWGAQIEESSYPTSYIPTSGSTVTRAEETCNGAGSASTFNSTEGVLYAEIAAFSSEANNEYISISDGTNDERVVIGYVGNNNIRLFVKSGGTFHATTDISLSNALDYNKIAFKYKSGDNIVYLNGNKVNTDTDTYSLSAFNVLQFSTGNALSNHFYGKTKGVYVFNEALTDDELQQLTGPEYNSFAALAAAYNYTVI